MFNRLAVKCLLKSCLIFHVAGCQSPTVDPVPPHSDSATLSLDGSTVFDGGSTIDFGSDVNVESGTFDARESDAYAVALCTGAVFPKPSGWWRFDEPSGTSILDVSGNGNNGTIMAGLVEESSGGQRVFGRTGEVSDRAIELDGATEWVRIVPRGILDTVPYNEGITVSVWVKPSNGDAVDRPIVNIVHREFEFNGLFFIGWRKGVPAGGIITTEATGGKLTVGQWTHLAFTYNGIDEALYVNGVLVATSSSGLPGAQKPAPITLGARIDFNKGLVTDAFDGVLDDVAIFSEALTPAQVAWLARGCVPPNL